MSEMKELKLQSEIENRIGKIVEDAEKLITERGSEIASIDASSQIRNAMAVANSAPHPAVVTNFIRYQMGRKGAPGEVWKNTGLGEAVIKAIDGSVHTLAKEAVERAGFGDVHQVQVQMTRLLLGFMNRRYVYEYDKRKASSQAESSDRPRQGRRT